MVQEMVKKKKWLKCLQSVVFKKEHILDSMDYFVKDIVNYFQFIKNYLNFNFRKYMKQFINMKLIS